ncbi:MAG TPA: RbsD/FucU family protein [Humisphaera sp.]|nr:RbsD/FucU family protein [Humisphaera sp.]
MIKSQLLHPQILAALARSGHGSKVLISDGNYPHWTKRGHNAEVVFLNFAPGLLSATDVLKGILTAIPIEAAEVMETIKEGPLAMKEAPPIWAEFTQILHDSGADVEVTHIERHKFYDAAGTPDVCLTIATGDQRLYANLLLTIGVVKPKK